MIEFLTIDDIFESHRGQIANYGGGDGLHDIGLLESAVAQPQSMFNGEFLHKSIFEMAAAYLFHLVQNHPFVDGNKRVGLEAALLFLELNGFSLEVEDGMLIDLVLRTAEGKSDKSEIAAFFELYCA